MNLDALLRITAKVAGQENLNKLTRALGGVSSGAEAAKRSFKDVASSASFQAAAVAAAGIGVALGTSVNAAIQFESAMADVRKVVPGLEDAAGLRAMEKTILDLSRELPISAEGFAQIVAAAGQAGIAKDELEGFARSAAQMGVAFDISAGEAGESMAKLRTSMGLSQQEVVNLADAMNHLSNSMASSAPEITNFMLRVGAFGQQVAMTEEQTAALGSAMIAAGAPAEVAATSFRNLIKEMAAGPNATKKQEAAWESLGLTAEGVAERMQVDAVGTIRDVFGRLAELPEVMRIPTTEVLFGNEARALAPLLRNLELFDQSLAAVGDRAQYTGSMLSEFEARSGTSANSLQVFRNNVEALQIEMGRALLPALTNLVKLITPIVKVLGDAAGKFPALTTAVVGLAAAFSALVLSLPFVASFMSIVSSLGGAGAIIASVGAAIAGIGATIAGWAGAVVPVLAGVGAALKTLGAILAGVFTGPVGWVALLAAAVVALIAFREPVGAFFSWMGEQLQQWIAALWQWGEPVRDFWTGLWDSVRTITTGFVTWLGQAFRNLTAPLREAMAPVVELFRSIWDQVRGVVTGFLEWHADAIRRLIIEPIRNALSGILDFFRNAWEAVRAFLMGWFGWWGDTLYRLLIEPISVALAGLTAIFRQGFEAAARTVRGAWAAIAATFDQAVVQPIQAAWQGLTGFLGSTVASIAAQVQAGWGALSAGFYQVVVQPIQTAWGALQTWMQEMVQGAAGALARAYESIAGGIVGAFRGIVGSVGRVINSVIKMINKLIGAVNTVRATVGMSAIQSVPLVEIPGFAQGGMVRRPTLAMVGEGGEPEYIVPSSKMASASAAYLAGVRGPAVLSSSAAPAPAGGGGVSVSITTGPVLQHGGESYVRLSDLETAAQQIAAQIYSGLRSSAGRRSMGWA